MDLPQPLTNSDRPRPAPRSIALYLLALALVALVPAFVFSAVLLQRNNEAQERVVETLMTGSARSIMQAVDREVSANISTLKILAVNHTLQVGDLESFYNQVRTALEGSRTYVYALNSDFYSILSTRREYGSPPLLANDVPSAKKALATNDIVVSGVVKARTGNGQVFNVLFPVRVGKYAPLVLGISRDASTLESALLSDKLPDGWRVAMVDAGGLIVAGSDGAGTAGDRFSVFDLHGLETSSRLVNLDAGGELYTAAIRQSALTGWTLIAWAPSSIISRPLMDTVWSLAVGGLLLAALVVLVIYWVTRQIAGSVRGLEAEAKRLGAGQPVTARDYPISEIATVSAAIGEASIRRQQAEAEVRFLMRELAHRSKNQMTVIAAMAKQTARGAESVPEFVQNFEKRIFGLARSTDLLLANGVVGVDLKELIAGQLGPFEPEDQSRLLLDGPPTRLNMQAAQIVGMAIHELATNAVKYGAFRRENGMLSVTWSRTADALHLLWRETVTPFTPPSGRRGFGTTVLESMVGRSLEAKVERIVREDGLDWVFEIPIGAIDPAKGPEEAI
jgi:two-component sensor histidine kinase